LQKGSGEQAHEIATLNYEIELLKLQLKDREDENRRRNRAVRSMVFEQVAGAPGEAAKYFATGRLPAGAQAGRPALAHCPRRQRQPDTHRWRRSGRQGAGRACRRSACRQFSWDMVGSLLATAIVISLVGFMEAISIAKAIAAKTKQKIDPNQELIGQGLANLVGAMTQSFPVSGSFSRSAVNINAGAITGMSSVITAALRPADPAVPDAAALPPAAGGAGGGDHHGGDRDW
jgi:SulP family sulfate permease